jgi:hypothetical protein
VQRKIWQPCNRACDQFRVRAFYSPLKRAENETKVFGAKNVNKRPTNYVWMKKWDPTHRYLRITYLLVSGCSC